MNRFIQHLKLALRSLFSNKIYSAFNIVGFAMGFTVCIITGLYIYREFSVDKCFKEHQRIYRVVDDENNLVRIDYDLAEKFRNLFPDIKEIAPAYISMYELVVKKVGSEDYITVQNVISTENGFFKVFQPDFLVGNPVDPFNSEPSVVLPRSTAEKLFGRIDILGEQVFAGGGVFPVNAVVEDLPENSTFKADLFLNSATGIRLNQGRKEGSDNWFNPYPIFALLNEGVDVKSLEEKINANFPENKSETKKIRLQPLTNIYFDTMVTDSNNYAGNRPLVYIFLSITLIILILSVINYVNFALSKQLETMKQLGVKKAFGASFRQLRAYYLVEIGLAIFFSFLLSLAIGIYTLPLFEQVLGVHLEVGNILTPVFLLSILAILAGVVLVASFTPFYIISKFDIQTLFGKKQTYIGKQKGKMILTGCQIAVTIILFTCLFMFHKQLEYMKTYDLGFNKNHLLRIEVPNSMSEVFQNEITKYDFVRSSVISYHAPGFMGAAGFQRNEQNDRDVLVHQIITDIGFLNTFGLQLVQGRDFTDADRDEACIINEETMRQLGWNSIEGKKCNDLKVIGVVKDFNISSLHHRAEPVNIIPLKKENFAYGIISINFKGDVRDALAGVRESWGSIFPGEPFHYRFYSEVFDSFYQKEERQSTAIAIISIIAIVITCMGLVGQVKQTSLSKTKEIGIRKINGATIAEMMYLIPNSYLKIFSIAFVAATPIAWLTIEKWLQNFAFKTDINWWVFALSGIMVLLILAVFILWETWKAATANPADIIRME